jgi:hypothetical protein
MALECEFEFYLERQEELVSQYDGKFVVIHGREVIGSYDDEIEAIERTAQRFPLGSFLVQKCEPGSESYTQTFHSPVVVP